MTGPKRVERPLTPTEAANVVVKFVEADIPKFCPQVSTLKHVLDLAKRLQIRESDFFDALIAATMIENGVDTIYTANEGDFQKFEEIKVINPLAPRP